jgi:hypothetical protein
VSVNVSGICFDCFEAVARQKPAGFFVARMDFPRGKPSFAAKGQGCGVIKTIEIYSLVEGIRKTKMEF